jgi:hypothetical protein
VKYHSNHDGGEVSFKHGSACCSQHASLDVSRHADASPVAWRYRTHDVELLRREERLRYVLNKVYGAWRVMMLSEVSLPEETRCIGIAAAEPAPCMPAYDALKARMKLTRPTPDRRFSARSSWKLSAPYATFDGPAWLHGCMRDSNAPPVGRPIAIGDGIRLAGGASLRS